MQNNEEAAWVDEVKRRGWERGAALLLDVVEPFGAFGAQLLYVIQPAFGIFGLAALIHGVAEALETPDGIAALRDMLEEQEC